MYKGVVKETACTAHARTTLEYASPAWDPSTSEDVTKLEKVQRQAARFVHNNYYDRAPGCVSKMVSDLGWEPLQHRRRVDRLTTLFKIQHELVELDTDVVRPGHKRMHQRSAQTLPASCQVVHPSQGPSRNRASFQHQSLMPPP